jgi:hypothetical protein
MRRRRYRIIFLISHENSPRMIPRAKFATALSGLVSFSSQIHMGC